MIEVRLTGERESLEFKVVVREGRGDTHDHVAMTP
jgi:hypothetical protein